MLDEGYYIPPNPAKSHPKPVVKSPKAAEKHIIEHDYKLLNKDTFREVLRRDESELKFCHKLKEAHIEVKGQQRQNVRMAAQTLSNTVSKAIEYCVPEGKTPSQAVQVQSKL